jgi:hypothetical protein
LRVQATNLPSSFEVTTDGAGVVGHAGAALLQELADRLELTAALGWRGLRDRRRHPDAAVLRDLAVVLADGGDCLSDLAVLRDQPALFGPVASTPTAWRVLERTASDPDGLAGCAPPTPGLVPGPPAATRTWSCWSSTPTRPWCWPTATTRRARRAPTSTASGSRRCWPTWTCGQAPGEPLAGLLRPGNAAPGATADLIELVDLAVAQLPVAAAGEERPVLVRSDSAGGSSKLAWHLRERGIGFTLGMQVDQHVREAILAQPEPAWTAAVAPDGQPRPGAEVCELTGWVDLANWPHGTRVLCRREDAHPGAQLRFTDVDGRRFQVFVTDQLDGDLARLELRHRQRARVEDRIRAAKATGLANLPFDRWRRNQVWLELVLAAQDLTCWTQALLLGGALAVAEPKALRHRLWHVAARIVRHARRLILRPQATWPWAVELARAFARLRALPLRC